MKELFPGYYPKDPGKIKELWDAGLFVLDASVLLKLYMFTVATRREFLTVLRDLADQLWIPHQAAAEYQRHRLRVIRQQLGAANVLSGALKNAEQEIRKALSGQHPFADSEQVEAKACAACQSAHRKLGNRRAEYQRLIEHDAVREELDNLLADRVGPPYEPDRLMKLYKTAEERYKLRIPPGFSDEHKFAESAFGDFIIWTQLLEKAGSLKRPVIFVTDDQKEDWWTGDGSGCLFPRHELVDEFTREVGAGLHMYTTDGFLSDAEIYLGKRVRKTALDELKALRASNVPASFAQAALRAHEQLSWFLPVVSRAMDQMQHTGAIRAMLEAQKAAERFATSPFVRSVWETQRVAERIAASPAMQALVASLAHPLFQSPLFQETASLWLKSQPGRTRERPLEDGSQVADAAREEP